jgi:hypothetical protein
MGNTGRPRSTADPLTLLKGVRRMSSLRLDDITRGLENLANPSARGMLESLGRTREEQVATMAEMLRNSSEADIEEMGQVFGLAMSKLAEERSHDRDDHCDRLRRRREQSAAEWRRQRRLTS